MNVGGASGAFQRRTVLGLVLAGFIAFVAMLYFIGAGDTGSRGNDGRAHAASNGLNGFAGLARLLELEGRNVTLSRSPGGLDTDGLLVLTPPPFADAEELSQLLEKRQHLGPTLVILPKWNAAPFPENLPAELKGKLRKGWVRLLSAEAPDWPAKLPAPYTFTPEQEELEPGDSLRWEGMGASGDLPSRLVLHASDNPLHDSLVTDAAGHVLAADVLGEEGSDFYENAHNVIFVIEPDLLDNYGLADPQRAALALELVSYASYGEDDRAITFDLTLNGFGAEANLLTLAFTPPFLAATLCLILALVVVGWRAFRRFGPAVAEGPAIAYGKRNLVANGAGLILRARRLRLLADPYAALIAQRIRHRLGLARPDPEAIDAALARRLPGEEGFAPRAAALRAARRQSEILRAAAALKELEGKLLQ